MALQDGSRFSARSVWRWPATWDSPVLRPVIPLEAPAAGGDTTVDYDVAASGDDANAGSIASPGKGPATANITAGDITAALLSPGSHGAGDNWSFGARFVGVAVPQAAVIVSATLVLTGGATYAPGGITVRYIISGQDEDTAQAFTTGAGDSLSNGDRPRTTADATMNVPAVTANVEYSVDITAIVQELVNRAGWVSGNAMALLGDNDAATTTGEWQDFHSYDGDPTRAPRISITYSGGGGGGGNRRRRLLLAA